MKGAYAMKFDETVYEVKTLEMDGLTVTYREFRHIPYVSNPVDEIQKLSVYVPEGYYHGETINGYRSDSAPVFLPNSVGGYMPGPEQEPGKDFIGRTNSLFYALRQGYVVVSPGVRGRGCKNGEGKFTGIAPADIVDLKAAVRWIRNNPNVPGDHEKIISNGTSAGGAMSALQGCTGNHPDYEPYLKEIGACEGRDDVFMSSCYCPITNLDHADMAYEWEFNGLNHFKMGMDPAHMREGDLTEEQESLSSQLKDMFPAYVMSLSLPGIDSMDAFLEVVKKHVIESAETELSKGTDLEADPAVTAWLSFENHKPVSVDWKKYVAYRTRMKPVPAFDAVEMNTPENELFGTADIQFRHFTDFSYDNDPDKGEKAEDIQIRLMNPMYYIDDEKAVKAKHIRIRHGAVDRDTSLAISNLLYLKLKNAGVDVNIAHPWGIPHAGDYDLPEMFAWIDSFCR